MRLIKKFSKLIISLELTLFCLSLLIVLVAACTLAQVQLGTWGAVKVYMRSWFVYWESIPVYPGGVLIGLVLMINLIAAQFARLELKWRKTGIWLTHAGLILLFAGEFATGMFAVETQMVIEEGQTRNFVENPRVMELALIDASGSDYDEVISISQKRLARGGMIRHDQMPFRISVKEYYENAAIRPGSPPLVIPRDPVSKDDEVNQTAAFIELLDGGKSIGTWLVSNGIEAPHAFEHQGRSYRLILRPERHYLPYSVTLKDFTHDLYPGTDIPKNFSSLIRLEHPEKKENRDILIYMNHPLRYEGRAFYQASFGKNDTLSVLQVVENPGWLLPYISCALVTLGLLFHFILKLRGSRRAA